MIFVLNWSIQKCEEKYTSKYDVTHFRLSYGNIQLQWKHKNRQHYGTETVYFKYKTIL